MTIYVVSAGDFYESNDICELFIHEADAHAYAAQLEGEYDWAEVTPQTVHQGALQFA